MSKDPDCFRDGHESCRRRTESLEASGALQQAVIRPPCVKLSQNRHLKMDFLTWSLQPMQVSAARLVEREPAQSLRGSPRLEPSMVSTYFRHRYQKRHDQRHLQVLSSLHPICTPRVLQGVQQRRWRRRQRRRQQLRRRLLLRTLHCSLGFVQDLCLNGQASWEQLVLSPARSSQTPGDRRERGGVRLQASGRLMIRRHRLNLPSVEIRWRTLTWRLLITSGS